MVEFRIRPVSGAVAVAALFATAALVMVVVGMAGKTESGSVLVGLVLVAARALCFPMFSDQGEVRSVVIECNFLPPQWAMTVGADFTEKSFVGFVFYVAGNALGRGFAALLAGRMAIRARGFDVLAE